MDFHQIIYSKENRVATITLNRPTKLNAYSEVMVHEIITALSDSRDDDEVRAVIITGAGRGFCSGCDLTGGDTAGAVRSCISSGTRIAAKAAASRGASCWN